MSMSSQLSLSRAAIQNNWKFLHDHFPNQQISAVVKGNAYGHGIDVYAPLVEAEGVNHFSVFNSHEAYQLKSVLRPETEVMIMGDMSDADIDWAIMEGVSFYVFDIERLQFAIERAKVLEEKAMIHIEVETGMYRTGFSTDACAEVADLLKENAEHLIFKGLCMHFAGAESISNYLRINKQKKSFKTYIQYFNEQGLSPEKIHACCSAAAIRLPDMKFDMLRIGILQYGFWPNTETFVQYATEHNIEASPLQRVISWDSHVMSIKNVPANTYIGYGSAYFTHNDMRLAIVPVGYAYGFDRGLSNMGVVLVDGRRSAVVGVVNMNCMAVDITDNPSVKIGDKVTMIGDQKDISISVASFGEMSNQLNYELLTRLPQDTPRMVVD